MTVLVCGGRSYRNWRHAEMTLDRLDIESRIERVISGAADGADQLGIRWAIARGRAFGMWPADWKAHGRSAGPIRNQQMLEEGKPDLVVAFPGSKGTKDMMERARRAGVRVICG